LEIRTKVLEVPFCADNISVMNQLVSSTRPDQPALWLTVHEAASRLGVCNKTIYTMLRQGELPGSWKKRKSWRIPPAAVDAANNPPVPGKRLTTEA
jgi:excisionase family DNA binding protein